MREEHITYCHEDASSQYYSWSLKGEAVNTDLKSLAIVVGVLWLSILVALPETLPRLIGNGDVYAQRGLLSLLPHPSLTMATEPERRSPPPKPSFAQIWRLLCNWSITISSTYMAILFATYFSIALDMGAVLSNQYSWSITGISGGYLGFGIASILGAVVGGRYSDLRRNRAVTLSPDGESLSHNRIADQIWGTMLCAAGSIMYGWFVERSIHPAAVLSATLISV